MAALVNLDSYCLVVSDEVGVVGGIHTLTSIDEAYHVSASDNVVLSLSWHATLDAKLTAPVCSGQFGERINGSATLPDLGISGARSGATLRSTKLPTLESSGELTGGQVGTLSKRLPAMTVSATTGIRGSSNLKLPTFELEITATGDRLGVLNKRLPGLTISAEASTPVLSTLVKDLPALTISANGSTISIGRLNKTLPPVTISASLLVGATATLSSTLPALELTGTPGLYGASMSLDAMLPTLVAAVGTGGLPGIPASITVEGRFTDYVLRHVR